MSYVYAPHNATYSNVYPGQKFGQAKPIKTKKALIPATEKQVSFIKSLMKDRVVTDAHSLKIAIDAGTLTKGAASERIEALLASPKRDKSSDHKVVSQPKVTPVPGYYVSEADTFYKVVESKAHKFYAKKFVVSHSGQSASWVYAPGAINAYATWKKVSLTDATQFGIAHGFCLCCGKLLTDPNSVKAGIGPICAKKF